MTEQPERTNRQAQIDVLRGMAEAFRQQIIADLPVDLVAGVRFAVKTIEQVATNIEEGA